MNPREVAQYLAFIVNTIMMCACLLGMYANPARRWGLSVWFLYGGIGFAFYFMVLILEMKSFGSAYSPFRVIFQDTLVASAVLLHIWQDIVDWWEKWKS